MTYNTTLPCPPTGVLSLLQQQREEHVAEIARMTTLMNEVEDPVGDEPGARAAQLLEISRSIHEERTALAEADAALERVVTGAYGLCEECAQPIAVARLELLPRARCCVQCQSSRALRA